MASTKTWKHRHRALSVQPGSTQTPRVRTCVPRARPGHTHRLLVSPHVSCARLAHTLHRVRLSAPHVSRGVPTTIRILLRPVCHAVPGSTRPKQAPHAQTVNQAQWTSTMIPPRHAPHVTLDVLRLVPAQAAHSAQLDVPTWTLMLRQHASYVWLEDTVRPAVSRVLSASLVLSTMTPILRPRVQCVRWASTLRATQ